MSHVTIGHHFQGQKVKSQLAGGGAYCGHLPHSLLTVTVLPKYLLYS